MDLQKLIDEITDIVISRVSSGAENPAPQTAVVAGRKSVAVVLTQESNDFDLFVKELKCLSPFCDFLFFVSDEFCIKKAESLAKTVPGQLFSVLPSSWKRTVSGFDAVIVPVMNMTLCSKTAQLIADDVPSKIVIQSLMEQKAIFAGSEEISLLRSASARLPKPLLSVFSANLNLILSMGVREISVLGMAGEISGFLSGKKVTGDVRPNNVVTKEDIDSALRDGVDVLEFRFGTIVTPLARDYAQSLNMKIIFR